jgi:hypothetical protein
MTDPEAPIGQTDLERALLDAGRSYRSSAEARQKTKIALGLAGSTAAGAVGAASLTWLGRAARTVAGRLGGATGGTKVIVALSLAGAAAGIPIGRHAWQGRGAPGAPAPAAVTAPVVAPPAAAAPPAIAPAPVGAPPAVADARSRPGLPPRSDAKAAARDHDRDLALGLELAQLDEARAALGAGDARGALALLDAYTRAHPHGSLALEAEIVRIDALARDGQRDLAKRRAEAFLRRHPKSVLAARARGFLLQGD